MNTHSILNGLKYRLDRENKTATVVQVVYDLPEVIIPEIVDGCTVKHINYDVFVGRTELEKISFPDTMEHIGLCAFYECTNLREVRVYATGCSSTVLEINDSAFAYCINLQEIFFDQSMNVHCHDRAFFDCKNLSVLNCRLITIGKHAFCNCLSLKDVVFGHDVLWEPSSFQNCKKLKQFTFLGSISSSVSESSLKRLLYKKVYCYSDSGLEELAYRGVNIEILEKYY